MAQSAIVRWSNPNVVLVATNLLEGHKLMLHAIYQAQLSRAKVLLVHVVPFSRVRTDLNDGRPFVISSSEVRYVKAKLDELVQDFQREGVECEPVILSGRPGEQIARLAKSQSVARVIVASRNTDGVARLVEESVSEELIATLEIPVCVIGRRNHTGPARGTPLGRILLASSLERGSAMIAGFASTLAEINHSHLVMLHVLNTVGMKEQQRELAKYEARKKLFELIPNEAQYSKEPVCLVKEGDPATIITAEAGSYSQDLVILGSPHPSVVSWLLGTSVVHQVVIESECPVITVNAQATSESANRGFSLDLAQATAQVSTGDDDGEPMKQRNAR